MPATFPAAALELLACPHCAVPAPDLSLGQPQPPVPGPQPLGLPPAPAHSRRPLTATGPGTVGCAAGHRFDLARQGYLTLLGPRSRTDTGDTGAMLAARLAFLGAGHYAPIAAAVADACACSGPVLEVGAGTGYYLAAAIAARADRVAVALDSSRYAARRTAADPRLAGVLADAWAPLPILDGAFAVVLSVFAPRDAAEMCRVLAPGGRVVVVTPEPDHLAEIVGSLDMLTVDGGKAGRLADAFAGLAAVDRRHRLRFPMSLRRSDLRALVEMGPTARHRDRADTAAAADRLPEPLTVTASVTLTVLRRR